MRVISDIDISQKRVFVRADLDVPIETTKDERLTSNAEIATRLTNLKPTVDYLLGHGASQIVIAGHIDRPTGSDPAFSTKQLIKPLEKILGREILFVPDLFSHSRHSIRSSASYDRESDSHFRENDSGLILLENLRFWPGETENNQEFAKQLANLADIYINEAFGNCHRNHASVVALPALLPHAAGIHLAKEVEVLSALLKNPKKPFVAIVGGAKIETKLPLVEHLSKIADFVLVGGELPKAIENLKLKIENLEHIIIGRLTEDGKDISEESIKQFTDVIANAKTVVWNGPLGLFEQGYDKGSIAVARAIIESPAYEVVGGGETVEFLVKNNLLSRFSFVSSGGGAMLEFLSGKTLSALKALE